VPWPHAAQGVADLAEDVARLAHDLLLDLPLSEVRGGAEREHRDRHHLAAIAVLFAKLDIAALSMRIVFGLRQSVGHVLAKEKGPGEREGPPGLASSSGEPHPRVCM